jgi:hypothetical protein
MCTKIVFDCKLPKRTYKKAGCAGSEGLNGYYNYDTGERVVNVCSFDFQGLPIKQIHKKFAKVDTHELLHHLIYQETGKESNETEERLIEIMVGDICDY